MGAGSLGPVFRAHDPAENRLVALKVFRIEATPEQSAELAGFLEQLVEQQPRHPAIAAALASGVAHGSAYLAQEYVTDEALDASLRQHGQPPLEAVLVTLSRLAEALDRAAGEGIHHGALHPRDVLVARGGEPRLIDLGVAQALQRAGLRAPIRRPYSAPERVAGEQWGGAADLFSLGALAHELVTGRRISGPGAPAVAPEGPAGLDLAAFADVLARALALDPSSRFASASDLVDELRPILARGRRLSAVRRSRLTPVDAGTLPLDLDEFERVPRVVDEVVALPSETIAPPRQNPPETPTLAEVMQTDRFADVLQEEARSAFEHEPGVELADEPPADVPEDSAGSTHAAAVDTPAPLRQLEPEPEPEPEPERALVREPEPEPGHDTVHELGATLLDRPALRGATWSPPVASPVPDRPLLALLVALMVGLAGGFGIGYWVAWRSAVREAAHVLAAASATANQPTAASSQTAPPAPTASAPATTRATPPAPAPRTAPAPAQAAARPKPAPAPEPERARPAREAPVTGTLVVRSTPEGAHVRVDGKLRGRTPLSLRDLPLRGATVTIEQAGYRPDERRIALSAAHPTVTLDARLTKEAPERTTSATTGALVIESRPVGARVFLDDQEIGVTPLSLPDIAPGAHRVRLEMPGFTRWITTSQVTAGARTRVAASLEQGPSQ